ncbi:acyl-CoA dehydrogenase [Gordonia pseudamarae]|uniref:Acyl-CoA dehydrogenase n=2 Tax=Gordoniaceae TaxID=85026 RepID=A0ABX6IF52_9ACTN|nr:acyl-CoA dehydrogenase [Gordonia sp. (in: high G+C Gram-positive bacteria)]QHN25024.1 acyl-CoA dehydrogenase [Gordonia pseudamarae]QHN33959.1 acyl-CoA dehydrogenase [Gordonia pseudamarae]
MDFALDSTACAVRDVAADVLSRHEAEWSATFGKPAFGEHGTTHPADDHDAKLWQALVDAGLLALTLPESVGGDDLGVLGVAPLLSGLGAAAAVTPAVGAVAAALTLRSADAATRERLAAPLTRGAWYSVAASEPGDALTARPATRVVDGTLTGTKTGVLHADGAHAFFVTTADGVVVVPRDATGVDVRRTPSSSGAGEYTVTFTDVAVAGGDVLGVDSAVLRDHYRLALARYADGLIDGATRLTADHVSTREQFGKPIALFQAVSQQLADIYVIGRGMRLATTAAGWRLSQGLEADRDLTIALYWLAAEIPATMRTMTHLHGGIGVDITYPLHRYFSVAKDLARLVGGAYARLDELASTSHEVSRLIARAPHTSTGEVAATSVEVRGTSLETSHADNVHADNVTAPEDTTMFVDLTAEQYALRDEMRSYFTGLVSSEDAREMLVDRHGAAYRKVIKRMGDDGRLGVGWPKEYGGKGFGEIEQQIFTNEAVRADVPLPSVTLQTVGPTLQALGTEEQKKRFLPAILAGEVHFAIGYTEPGAGTDLASLVTTAVRDGDHYIVNGQKIFTTGGHDADYIWLACRTDPNGVGQDGVKRDVPKHKGITILIVDTKDPGFSWTPIITADGAHHVNATYYNDVRVPVSMRVGDEGGGWRLITTQLNHERVMLGPAGKLDGLAEHVRDWARGTGPDGSVIGEHTDVRRTLAQIDAYVRINELLNWQVAATGEAISMADAAATKVFSTERLQLVGRMIDEIVGRFGDLADEATADLVNWLDAQQKRNAVITFGGGVNEVMRDMIATAGLGLPRAKR